MISVSGFDDPKFDHLPRDPGSNLPLPINTAGSRDSFRSFASVCVGRNAFLAMTQRCGICGHRLNGSNPCFVVWTTRRSLVNDGYRQENDGQWSPPPKPPDNPPFAHAAGEGLLHPHCLSQASSVCPFLLARGISYQTVNDDGPTDRLVLVGQAIGVTLGATNTMPNDPTPFALVDRQSRLSTLATWLPPEVDESNRSQRRRTKTASRTII